jgi:D-beta-D-heptose 7-phosphate kinase/D-beta-D-heptose 1-phosphate adenosyltransferase
VAAHAVLRHPRRRTLCKQRLFADDQLLARLDWGDAAPLIDSAQRALVSRLGAEFASCDALILSDYDYGAIGPELQRALVELQNQSPRAVVGDSKRLQGFPGLKFTAIKPNYEQAIRLLGLIPVAAGARVEQIQRHGAALLDVIDTQLAVVTLDRDGAVVFQKGRPPLRTSAEPHPHWRAAGAGDTFVAALTLALAAKAPPEAAAHFAATAAAIVVGKDGTATCAASELAARLNGTRTPPSTDAALAAALEAHRLAGRRIVLTSGCFDILHRGHVTYLHQARALGDVLVVGLNSDDSIRRLKGPERPINAVEDRLHVLLALDCVDYVVVFEEDTPHRLVEFVRPHVFVKGGDYTRQQLPEADLVEQLGGRIEILPLVRERSTTQLISRIRAAEKWGFGGGPSELAADAVSLPLGVAGT